VDEGATSVEPEHVQPAEGGAPAPDAAPGAAAPAAAAPLTPEQDSIREVQAFRRRQQSMESYESCLQKATSVDEPVRSTLREACGRSRGHGAKP
jgi:hypothetical protein